MKTTVTGAVAASLLGISPAMAYRQIREGDFPVPAAKIGGRYVVPTKPLLEFLGIDALPDDGDDDEQLGVAA
ncbi:helix-turn-helix domain-containing protein [Corynebacterium pseudopelargi]|uniref:Helix-turn-helix domain protein n=1 Tax=Corynebacterium pseudopelargi TaxID=2080757 RepID=A0A3G6IV46_9CORY|nr:helix-turn-helix domain-containing protein [Corynebacterium pseudopelargi]AZA08508.1 Helix-turn-helix domain protein [Corynebacterium pseudopelargi]